MGSDQRDRITQVQLRAGVTVRIWDLPLDLTDREATKIGNVVQALAAQSDHIGGEADGG